MQELVFLKEGGGLTLFPFIFFKIYHFYIHLEMTLLFAKSCYEFEEKPQFYEKRILSCLK